MKLGISSLGHLLDFTTSNEYDDLFRSVFNATESCLNYAENNGIEIVELVIEPQSFLRGGQRQEFVDLVASYSLRTQVHGPYIDLSLCSHNQTISQATINAYVETYNLCRDLQVNLMTIHPGVASSTIESLHRYNQSQLTIALNVLIDLINDRGFSLCLENMPKDTNIMLGDESIARIFSSLKRSDLYLTYDTSHYYTNSGNVEVLWKNFHDIIKNIHLVDNYTKEADPHPPLGTGEIDFEQILEIISTYQYNDALIVELSSAKGLPQSIHYINKFL